MAFIQLAVLGNYPIYPILFSRTGLDIAYIVIIVKVVAFMLIQLIDCEVMKVILSVTGNLFDVVLSNKSVYLEQRLYNF